MGEVDAGLPTSAQALAEVNEPAVHSVDNSPRPSARGPSHQHRTRDNGVRADRIGQPGDVAASVIFQVQVGRRIDSDRPSI